MIEPVALAALEPVVRAAWGADTCDPVDVADWTTSNPARGQCGATALVLHDLLGGDLLLAEVTRDDGSRQGVHYWNRLPDGTQVDLTREQFLPHEHVGQARAVPRPPGPPLRCAEQYARLRARVLQGLPCAADRPCPRPYRVARSRSSPSTGSTSGTNP